jgi:hypothetical protein
MTVEVKNIGDKKNINGQIVEWEIKTKRHKVESNKRRMRQDIEWELKMNEHKVESNKRRMGQNIEWEIKAKGHLRSKVLIIEW